MVKLDVVRIASIIASKIRGRKGCPGCPSIQSQSGEMRGEAQSLRVGHQRDGAADQGSGYGDTVRPGHCRLHQVRDCRRGVTLMYAQALRLGVSWSTCVDGAFRGS